MSKDYEYNMLFTKPKGMRFVDLAIWLDENIHKPDCDENTAIKYLYILIFMLASKGHYFQNPEDYDGFACYMAYDTYKRLIDTSKKPIKSSLNYIKSVINFRKMTYQHEVFSEIIDPEFNKTWNPDLYKEKSISSLECINRDGLVRDVKDVFIGIPRLIKESIPKLYNRSYISDCIYTSVLLSLVYRLTLPVDINNKLVNKQDHSIKFNDECYYRKHIDDNTIILWHLPDTYKDIVRIVINKSNMLLSDNIKDIIDDYKITNKMFNDISKNIIFGEGSSDGYEEF